MDFTSRNAQQPAPTFRPTSSGEGASAPTNNSSDKKRPGMGKGMSTWARWGSIGLLFCTVGLVVALILLVSFQKNGDEGKFVATNKYQAVFLTSGQVYFGKLVSVTDKYYDLRNIFLLQSNSNNANASSSSNSNLTLVKLGCQQIHDPYDEMIINRTQVSFWENLQDNGQVVKAIGQYQKQNPNGQNCTDQSQASGAQGGVQNNSSSSSTNSSTNSSSSSSNSTKKP
ncbi:MAG TPA: hypothetical protein VHD60_03280 [Candidatus Saccharimonadales bacterium]|nr:hypothetical protein [Candidatus Saccharimonadales bacterium]